ncbi:MAG TPA: hydrogenase-4 component E [Acetobacteraceae bacterium]|jgi:hydrogenase-4 component E|nr:hydrogenase-4 component E [Acetobacteraceae bacterium]
MPTHYGALSYDLSHLLGTAVLILSFGLLYQRRTKAVVTTYALQAVALAAAAAWQGYVQGAPQLYATAVITLAAKGVVIPIAMLKLIERLNIQRSVEPALGIFMSMVLGVGLVALAILVVLPVTFQDSNLTREDLALALSVVLLGQLVMISRRLALTQVIGFMSLENGLILAAVSVAGMPLVVELSVAVLILVAFVVFGIFFFRIRARFDSLDIGHFDRISSMHR